MREYAANRAVRRFRAQRELMVGRSVTDPFTCQAPEKARAPAKRLGRVDRMPSCPRSRRRPTTAMTPDTTSFDSKKRTDASPGRSSPGICATSVVSRRSS
ncbi:MAG: hypothetical protein INH41_10805 [Myxococcaceae bacterium]|nr:hypothetical protein [Myxococcaceae bacterium]MCA3012875.1 hypothetical protein [Myxococcaceae bacterium]